MRLGFDLDEVVVDLTKQMEIYLKDKYDIDWPVDCFVNYFFSDCLFSDDEELNTKIASELKFLCNDADFQFEANPMPDAVQVISALKRAGHKIYFISSRPKRNQPKTFRWLKQNNIPFDKLILIGHEREKGLYAKRYFLDMYVDDLEKHLLSMSKFKKRWRKGLLIFDRPWNEGKVDENKFKRVCSWKEILRHTGVPNR